MEENMKTTYENNGAPKRKKHNILTFVLCLLISLIIWLYIANVEMVREANYSSYNDIYESTETT